MTARQIPADLWPYVEAAIAIARQRLERGDEMDGTAFIDAPAGQGAEGVVVVPMTGAPTKDAWARLIRTVASFAEARFVLLVSEVWLSDATSLEELDRMVAQYKEVRLMPGRREAVLVQLETHDGLWQGEAEIVALAASAKGGRTFGNVEMRMPTHSEGRVVGLLGRRKRPMQ